MASVLLLSAVLGWGLAGCGASRSGSLPDNPRSGSPVPTTLSPTRTAVVAEARRWLGTPYVYGGNSREGVDCSGFIMQVFARFDILLPRRSEDQFAEGQKIPRARMRPGDLVFFSASKRRGITHVGIYLGDQAFIHASTSKGVIISRLTDEYYARRFAGAVTLLR